MVPSGSQSQYQTDSAFCFSVAFSAAKSFGMTVMLNASVKTAQQQQHHTGERALRLCGGLSQAAFHCLLLFSALFP